MSDNTFDKEDEEDRRIEEVKALQEGDFNKLSARRSRTNRMKRLYQSEREQKVDGKSRGQARTQWHPTRGIDDTCSICLLPENIQEEILQQYVAKTSLGSIKNKFGVRIHDIRRHARTRDWDYERAKGTEYAWSLLADLGTKNVINRPNEVTPDILIKVLNHIDRREGKITDRVEVIQAPAIQFVQLVPLPPPARNNQAITDSKVKLLSGSVLEASTSEITTESAKSESVNATPEVAAADGIKSPGNNEVANSTKP